MASHPSSETGDMGNSYPCLPVKSDARSERSLIRLNPNTLLELGNKIGEFLSE